MKQPSSFQRYLGDLEAELRSVLGDSESPLYTMMRYHLGWVDSEGEAQPSPGKMSRPTLCLLACEATGADWRSALPAAAAVVPSRSLHCGCTLHLLRSGLDTQEGRPRGPGIA